MGEHNTLFNPAQDAYQDLQEARARALRERKNVLIELGADWCDWCHRLDTFIRSHPDLSLLRSHRYIHVRLYVGEEERLSGICEHLPPFDEVPYFFVFRPDGHWLHSQATSPWEDGQDYNYERIWEFLSMWGDKEMNQRLQ